jgi:hypothetical protein
MTSTDNSNLIIETVIEEIEKNIEGLIHLSIQYTPGNKQYETPPEIVNVLWTMIVHNVHNLMVLQKVVLYGKKPDEQEYEALFLPAQEEAGRRMEAFIEQAKKETPLKHKT